MTSHDVILAILEALADYVPAGRIALVFFVPKDVFPNFDKFEQVLVTKDGEKEQERFTDKQKTLKARIDQYVMTEPSGSYGSPAPK